MKIATSDVLIEGAGTATHIENIDTEGKPSNRALFTDNVLTDVASDHQKLNALLVNDILEPTCRV